ncbi:putative outer membrane starch-binding protein [Arcticibacter tournemirensis]|uniref:RagB/SusD family nutrient uptake outer membrane protein n=1 Tax=Arcticibacter tournemirensis TaxID=699437 RepID=A0A4V1KHI8_9SPHI|nr:RagB/SusD family nutrient uptake outer membrane protein [Arcticibacter tournemirensis]KAA8476013.1 RagB/SusD family nutrient uptake outer membrane protein [Arcticibacter tournemirensis]RXF67342.1 RagB/SusD family nutrient uptake outer membrane protein [Arcticibacter tournemirensis]TQM50108.1 putative outer membrane starch-binding protein [Arcticibacter tournemirensis]
MRSIIYKYIILAAIVFSGLGCKKQLIEQPRSGLTPEYFQTAQGFQSGLDAAYAGNRDIWGNEGLMTMTVPGTDEFKSGGGGNSNFNIYSSSFDASSTWVSRVWNACYTYINTCNGVIDNGAAVTGLDAGTVKQKIAEAKFLRANYYFLLVRFWGPVTLNTHFIAEPSTSADRAPIADVYNFIIQDLKDAIDALPPSPVKNGVLPGKATAAAASHLLAKVYLTRAYTSAKQSDDFQNAYNIAKGLIDNSASLGIGLLPDFASVYAEGNEGSKEVLWSVQHTSNLTYNNNSNELNFYYVMGYENFPGLVRSMAYGRPYARVELTRWLSDTCFADKTNDTRYYKTFQSVWLSNSAEKIPKVNGVPKYALGDTAIYMPGVDVSDAKIAASRYLLVPPRNYTLQLFPTMLKYQDTKRASINDPSVRPVIVYRLAETYLLAAEAAVNLGDNINAAKYINAVRERAANPTGNVAAMTITSDKVSLDYVLDERSRELAGEQTRWLDLVRTNKLIERVKKHNPDAAANIQEKHVLRPIPQDQIDRVISGPQYPQNTGY